MHSSTKKQTCLEYHTSAIRKTDLSRGGAWLSLLFIIDDQFVHAHIQRFCQSVEDIRDRQVSRVFLSFSNRSGGYPGCFDQISNAHSPALSPVKHLLFQCRAFFAHLFPLLYSKPAHDPMIRQSGDKINMSLRLAKKCPPQVLLMFQQCAIISSWLRRHYDKYNTYRQEHKKNSKLTSDAGSLL